VRSVHRLALVALTALCGTAPAWPNEAWAATPEEQEKSAQLFDAGRRQMMQPGQLDQACAALGQAYALDARGDILLNLAECHRRQGKTATAWAEFDQAIRYGEAEKFTEAIDVAKLRRDELAAVLSRLTVAVAPEVSALEGFAIALDGVALPPAAWNTAAVRDPGTYVLTARAKGRLPFEAKIELGAAKDAQTVTVELALEPPPPPPAPPPPPPPPPPPAPRPLPVWAWVVGGAGLGMLGAAAGLGAMSMDAGNALDAVCGPKRQCTPQEWAGFDYRSARDTEVTTFGAFVGVGAAGLAAVTAAAVGLGVGAAQRSVKPTGPTIGFWLGAQTVGVRGAF
jgi:hypothetical protein